MTAGGTDLPKALPQGGVRPRAALRTILALMLREMSTRYGRSPGGYIWAVVEPLAGVMVLAVAFSLLMRSPPLGSSFVLFKATGMMPFLLYGTVSGAVSHAVGFSRPLLAYPGVTWMDTVLARFVLNTLTGVLVTFLVLGGIVVWTGSNTVIAAGPAMLSLGLVALLGLGVGSLNCFLFIRYPVWEQAWAIINRPLFLISGVLFLYESMPRVVQDILWWNPLMHLTGLMRKAFYPTYDANYVSVIYVLACAVIPLVVGLLLLRRHHQDLLHL